MQGTPDHFILICTTCQSGPSADKMRETFEATLPGGFAIRMVDCMAGCAHPRTVGIQAPGKAQYLFGDIQTASEIAALAEFAAQYRQSRDGWTNAGQRPPALYTKTLSRMPAILQEVP